ncbi:MULTISPECIES: GTP-sensing pleiotropic transcriptional regulator CodY [Aerococcus]|uniref:GTP-sensing pleiotropic transcriptional regulator CodY n=1 Tax=Aerococcus TaxID=1375 RepID=UPI0018A70237|nr:MULTISPECIES: GTP-sensing pleiotropic transcriptional regulator CodY [Aerococcus]MCY3035866.1 GTP-sensing pleiotropic transcriptional regulator CodY [Aerococcus sp. Group 2]MCY3038961.1 GTP-sensing pleiotropic transcriptional regulator CodY [Aerococcus sp. Group 2]MCY3040533.1 GTP-sensing pleiotropic transcriptional regulator CodY [Aerococcus sp. Group 2]MCY3042530.1 GTP-sensing pleiotropic transcriptional regulator CodY [Aerococcus sp. Group 2]MDK6519978.1 GTP-sensing pleiotropic transcrip
MIAESVEGVLEKIRDINKVIREGNIYDDEMADFPFQKLVRYLAENLEANAYLVSVEGELLGYFAIYEEINSERTEAMMQAHQLDPNYLDIISPIQETKSNIPTSDDWTILALEFRDKFNKGMTTIIPIYGNTTKLGYLILARPYEDFNCYDLILGEYVGTVLAMEMVFIKRRRQEEKEQKKQVVDSAIRSLSYSELNALYVIFKDLEEPRTRITASKIAKEENITRSVIVNALRKMESAGVFTSRSLGMKGTHIDTQSKENLEYLKKRLAEEV